MKKIKIILWSCFLLSFSLRAQITQAEYNWDNGPAQSLAATDGDLDEMIEQLVKSQASTPTSTGVHLLNIRVKDVYGDWSDYLSRVIYFEGDASLSEDKKLIQAEFNWDNGPATTVLAGDGTLDEVIESLVKSSAQTTDLGTGLHLLNLRVKGEDGTWGAYNSRVIYLEGDASLSEDKKLIQAEFNWDNGPATVIMATDGQLDEAIEELMQEGVGTDDVGEGVHLFNLRAKGDDGQWGPYFSRVIYFEPCAAPPLFLGQDTLICQGESITLRAGPGFSSYTWNDGSKNATLTVTEPGTYSVEVTHISGCERRDEIVVDFHQPVQISGPEHICEGDTVVLKTETNADQFIWNGEAGADSLLITSGGKYMVEVTEGACSSKDSVDIELLSAPTPDLGSNQQHCDDQTVVLDAGLGYVNYEWTGGSSPTRYLSTEVSGTYAVLVTDANGCKGSDTVEIEYREPYVVDLGPDQEFCEGEEVAVGVSDEYPSYEWLGIESNQSSVVISGGGTYVLIVAKESSCEGRDTITLTEQNLPIADFDFELLPQQVDFSNNSQYAESYSWDFGDEQTSTKEEPTHIYEESGVYDVMLKATNVCGEDSITKEVQFILTSLGGNWAEGNVLVYPNPARGSFTLDLGSDLMKATTVELFGLDGKVVRSREVSQRYTQLSTDDLSRGTYYLRISGGNGAKLIKMVID